MGVGTDAGTACCSGPQISPHTRWRGFWLDARIKAHEQLGMAVVVLSRKQRPEAADRRKVGAALSDPSVDYETLARFRYELRKFQAFSQLAAKRAGLTTQQHQALLAVRGFSDKGPVSVGDLARYLLIRHHTAVELVNRMTRLKVLSRSTDDIDGRRVVLRLTKEGERRLQKLSKIHLEELRAIEPTLTALLRPFHRPARTRGTGRP
jgi:DNA-binding MarR family transcriptional regulator